jgi:hypothetical protein
MRKNGKVSYRLAISTQSFFINFNILDQKKRKRKKKLKITKKLKIEEKKVFSLFKNFLNLWTSIFRHV